MDKLLLRIYKEIDAMYSNRQHQYFINKENISDFNRDFYTIIEEATNPLDESLFAVKNILVSFEKKYDIAPYEINANTHLNRGRYNRLKNEKSIDFVFEKIDIFTLIIYFNLTESDENKLFNAARIFLTNKSELDIVYKACREEFLIKDISRKEAYDKFMYYYEKALEHSDNK